MAKLKAIERLARGLAILSFVSLCWVAHRSLEERTQCVNSSFVSFVQIGARRVENCRFESRLSLEPLLHPLDAERAEMVRALEVLEPLGDVVRESRPRLAVEINLEAPHLFELGRGYIRLGRAWLSDAVQTRRALTMGVLQRAHPQTYRTPFQLETITDFLLATALGQEEWSGHRWLEELKFSTSAPSFAAYCRSPFRSLAHFDACALEQPEAGDPQANVWGFRPLLAAALARVFDKISLADKSRVMEAIGQGRTPPPLTPLQDTSIAGQARWLTQTLKEQAAGLGLSGGRDTEFAIQRSIKELEIDTTTHWELTVDLTHTPAWKDVLEQFRVWTSFRKKERVLVFTPEGAVALPSGLPVAWTADEIQSQKHVLIACQWPKPEEAVAVNARHIFARQLCGKVDQVFWN